MSIDCSIDEQAPLVSIIIRSFNESKYIEQLLVALRSQTVKNVEIILVDSGSVDGTVEIARKYCDKVLQIDQRAFTFGFALNLGIKEASHEYVGILSAHTLPVNDGWIASCLKAFDIRDGESAIVKVYGKQRGDGNSHFCELLDFERTYKDRFLIQSGKDFFSNNANSMILRTVWSDHPFNEELTGLEDIEWTKHFMAKGFRVAYQPEAEVYHFHRETNDQIFRRSFREAIAAKNIEMWGNGELLTRSVGELVKIPADYFLARRRKASVSTRDVLGYRWSTSKAYLKSIAVPQKDLKDFASNYRYDEFKVLEIESENRASLKVHSLNPVKPNEVLIKVAFVGICSTDLEVLRGHLEYYKSGWAKYPIVPGHEYSGIVVRKGPKVDNVEVGDGVVGECILSCGVCEDCLKGYFTACSNRREVGVINYDGACAEYLILESRFVHKIPPGLRPISASSIEPLAVVMKGFRRLGLKDSKEVGVCNVLVVGAGPIGHLSAQLAHHLGHRVGVIERNAERMALLADIPCEHCDTVTSFARYSYVVEATGVLDLANEVISKSKIGTSILLVGLPYGKSQANLESVVCLDKSIIGTVGSSYSDFEEALRVAPKLNFEHLDAHVFDFENWKEAYRAHDEKTFLKVKLRI
ncbi:glycosyltransferase [bacterium]|nr:MAG: glycosyltransferase [bacterium]